MIQGTGIDLVEISRIHQVSKEHSKFIQRVLTPHEQEHFHQYTNEHRKTEYLAGRFAAKEAYSKALGKGIGKHLSFQSIEIRSNENGQPIIWCNGEIQPHAHISISHSKQYAIAQVIIEK